MSIESKPTDKASELYWTNFWKQLPFPGDIDVTQKKSSNYVYRKLDKHFEAVFSNTKTTNASLLEIGCGNSAYLTYFHLRFGFQVNGIDYSTYACERTRKSFIATEYPVKFTMLIYFNHRRNYSMDLMLFAPSVWRNTSLIPLPLFEACQHL